MKITVLDAKTLGEDLSLSPLEAVGECDIYDTTDVCEVAGRIENSDVVVLNKIKLNESNLCFAKNLKLICVTATGYDNIDIDFCCKNGIAVCNVEGYSSHSVAQVTVSTALALSIHLNEYNGFVRSGEYSSSGVANRLAPVYHELYGKTWGIVGFGNIGKEVGGIAEALGCRLLVSKRTPIDGYDCVSVDELCEKSDIITIHTPLSEGTKHLINKARIELMKNEVIIVNAARGAVTDEAAVAEAIKGRKIGAFGCDVYSKEPFDKAHPFYEIKDYPNVLLTPHMAWGAYESRARCLSEIVLNIKDFYAGGTKGRVDL